MVDEGQAEAAGMVTTEAPKGMYVEAEYDEDVARGCVKVTELIAYDFDRMEKVVDEYTGKFTGKERAVEKGREPCFCQTPEDEVIYRENNPKARIETLGIQLLKSTAVKKLNSPENMKQFVKAEQGQPVASSTAMGDIAEKLGIKTHQRKKEDVLMDIITALSKEKDNG